VADQAVPIKPVPFIATFPYAIMELPPVIVTLLPVIVKLESDAVPEFKLAKYAKPYSGKTTSSVAVGTGAPFAPPAELDHTVVEAVVHEPDLFDALAPTQYLIAIIILF
jgi:hypothetical protein